MKILLDTETKEINRVVLDNRNFQLLEMQKIEDDTRELNIDFERIKSFLNRIIKRLEDEEDLLCQ